MSDEFCARRGCWPMPKATEKDHARLARVREFIAARYNAASVKDENPDAAAALREALEFIDTLA